MTHSDIARFWTWFASVCGEFGPKFENSRLVAELDQRLSALGEFSWELGPAPGSSDDSALVLTPAGRADLLVETRKIVDVAPTCDGWRFFSSIPPKSWNLRFTLDGNDGSQVEIDASEWRHVLHMYPDEVFDVTILASNILGLSADLQDAAAEIVLDGELGEELRMRRIQDIEIVGELDRELLQKSTSIKLIRPQIESLTKATKGKSGSLNKL